MINNKDSVNINQANVDDLGSPTWIERQMLKEYYEKNAKNLVFVPVFLLLTGYFLWDKVPDTLLIYWLVASIAVYILGSGGNYVHYKAVGEKKSVDFWHINLGIIGSICSLVIGFLPWVAFAYLSPEEVVVFTVAFSLAPAVTISFLSFNKFIWLVANASIMLLIIAYTYLHWDFNPVLGKVFAFWLTLYTAYMYTLLRDEHSRRKKILKLQVRLLQEKEKAERASQSKSLFLAAASHDIRQPVDALNLLMTVLKDKIAGQEAENILDKIDNNIASQQSIYDTLLSYSSLDSSSLKICFSNIDLKEVVSSVLEEMEIKIKEKNLNLITKLQHKIIFTDRPLLESIIRNLLSNAIRYTDEGFINVEIKEHHKKVAITIADTGVGISDADLKNIFDDFYQVEKRHVNDGCLGLGLSIVKKTLLLINGQIQVRSTVGKGSVFTVYLPVAEGSYTIN